MTDQEICDVIVPRYLAGENYQKLGVEYHVGGRRVRRVIAQKTTIRRPGAVRRYALNENYFETITTEAQAYWLGFLLADGCNHQTSAGYYCISLSLKYTDKSHVVKFRDAVGSTAPCRKITNKLGHEKCRVEIHSNKMSRDLTALECKPRKTLKHGIPKLNKELLRHLFRGLVDGDGSIFKTKCGSWGFNIVGSYRAVKAFKVFSQSHGVLKTGKIHKDKNLWRINVGGRRQIAKICELLYGSCSVALTRKQLKYRQLKAELAEV
jgi:hypothetical protein